MTSARLSVRLVRTVFLGSGEFGGAALRTLAAHPDIDLVGVVTAPPRPAGRGQLARATPIGAIAAELGVSAVLTPERLRAADAVAAVLALDPGLIVLADYGQIVPAPLLDRAHGALNLHPSLLPRHRGATPIPATILAADETTGVTLMRMDAGLDTGPIVAQSSQQLDGTETTPGLEATLALLAADLLRRSLGPWIRGELRAGPQPDAGATLTRPLRREDGRVRIDRSAATLARQVRALQPWPGSFVDSALGRIVILSAAADNGDGDGAIPGTFDALGLGLQDGRRLRFIEVRPAGGRAMVWLDCLRGRPALAGSHVVEPTQP